VGVDANWLARVRQSNQAKLGLAGMGQSSPTVAEQISAQFQAQRERQSNREVMAQEAEIARIKAANTPPPPPGSGPPVVVPLPAPSKIPMLLLGLSGVVALAGTGLLIYRVVKRR
jgi:hypothetical protein